MIFINIFFSVAIFYTLAISIIKFLPAFGLCKNFKMNRECESVGEDVSKKSMFKIFGIALTWRVILFIISLFSMILIFKFPEVTYQNFLKMWSRWDGERYVWLAKYGYGVPFEKETEFYNIAFFPLYPWLMRVLTLIIPSAEIAGMILSTLLYSGAMAFMYALVAKDYGKKVAKLSVLLISIAPFSFFFGSVMTESLFLFTTVLSWYLIKKKKWFLAALAGALCAMSRVVGVLILIPYVIEIIENNSESFKNKKYKEFYIKCFKQGIWGIITILGLGVYLLLNYHYTGNPFKFLEYQRTYWTHSFAYFGVGLQDLFKNIFANYNELKAKITFYGPQAISFAFSALLMALCCKKHKSAYTMYYVAYFIMVTSDMWYMSGGRFMLVIIPLYIMLAEKIKNNNLLIVVCITLSTLLYAIYSTYYFANYYIY